MAIEIQWWNDTKRVLLYTFPKQWTWDDFYQCKLKADAMLEAVDEHDHDIVLLFDMRESGPLPSNVFGLSRNVFRRAHPRGKPIIGVTGSRTVSGVVDMVRRFLPENETERFQMVHSIDEAADLIEQIIAEDDANTS